MLTSMSKVAQIIELLYETDAGQTFSRAIYFSNVLQLGCGRVIINVKARPRRRSSTKELFLYNGVNICVFRAHFTDHHSVIYVTCPVHLLMSKICC
jgi:hypothetical protein